MDVMAQILKITTSEQIAAEFKNTTKKRFTICIEDDVTKLSLKEAAPFNSTPKELIVVNFGDLALIELQEQIKTLSKLLVIIQNYMHKHILIMIVKNLVAYLILT